MEDLVVPNFLVGPISQVFRFYNNFSCQKQRKKQPGIIISCPFCRQLHTSVNLATELINAECGICWEERVCKRLPCSTNDTPHAFCLACLHLIDQQEVHLLELISGTPVPLTIYRVGLINLMPDSIDQVFTIYRSTPHIWLLVNSAPGQELDFYRFDEHCTHHRSILAKKIHQLRKRNRFIVTGQKLIPNSILSKDLNQYIVDYNKTHAIQTMSHQESHYYLSNFQKFYLIGTAELKRYHANMMTRQSDQSNYTNQPLNQRDNAGGCSVVNGSIYNNSFGQNVQSGISQPLSHLFVP